MSVPELHPVSAAFVRELWRERWGGELIHSLGTVYRPESVHGYVSGEPGAPAAAVTVALEGELAEIVSLDALIPGHGHGRAALAAAETMIRGQGPTSVRIVTTNDNLRAAALYLRAGYRLVRVHLDAMDSVRRLKPGIPLIGVNGIALRDEWELQKQL